MTRVQPHLKINVTVLHAPESQKASPSIRTADITEECRPAGENHHFVPCPGNLLLGSSARRLLAEGMAVGGGSAHRRVQNTNVNNARHQALPAMSPPL